MLSAGDTKPNEMEPFMRKTMVKKNHIYNKNEQCKKANTQEKMMKKKVTNTHMGLVDYC